MGTIIYYLVIPFIYLISVLPFRLLYLLSRFFYLVLYRLLGYRKNVVLTNLRNSFPEKSEREIAELCNEFYKFLCDLFLEVFKTLTISKERMLRRCSFDTESLTMLNKLADENKNIILVMGHYGNWEWAGNTFSTLCKHRLYVIYHPLGNKHFDKLMYDMRTRFGTRLIPRKEAYKEMQTPKSEVNATAFIADQTPRPDNAYWTTFLNQDTPVFKGTAIISRNLNYPLVYVSVKRIKRGYYQIFAELLTDNPAAMAENEISELYTKRLEQDIRRQPEIWLWSHKRWKHKRA